MNDVDGKALSASYCSKMLLTLNMIFFPLVVDILRAAQRAAISQYLQLRTLDDDCGLVKGRENPTSKWGEGSISHFKPAAQVGKGKKTPG
jgi:hypothetical protein